MRLRVLQLVLLLSGCGQGAPSQTVDDLGPLPPDLATPPPQSISYPTADAAYPIHQAITANLPTVTGGKPMVFSVAPALPAGLAIDPATGAILGTPSLLSPRANYVVTAANGGGSATVAIQIGVYGTLTNLTYSAASVTYAVGKAITPNLAAVEGLAALFSIFPSLPLGLVLDPSSGAISGTPSASSPLTSYTITATNPLSSTTTTLAITVIASPNNLVYTTSNANYPIGVAISDNSPSSSGGEVTSYFITPVLPKGLMLHTGTGVISGTPAVASPSTQYTITAMNIAGSASAIVSITVTAPPTNLTYATVNASYALNQAIPPNSPSSNGSAPTSYAVNPALPSGLSLNITTGIISGTPATAQAPSNYTITGSNIAGSVQATLSIEIIAPPSALSYATSNANYPIGGMITSNTPASSGGVPMQYAIAPSLPTGLSIDVKTGVISGTPTAAAAATQYTVTASNLAGSTTAFLSITVTAPPTNLAYATTKATYALNQPIPPNAPSSSGSAPTSYAVNSALPSGLSLSTTTGIISGTPKAAQVPTSYQVTASNIAGSVQTSISIEIIAPPTSLSYATSSANYPINVQIASNTPTSSGGTPTAYSVNPVLPAGLQIHPTAGVISGSPSVASASAQYKVTASNIAGDISSVITIAVIAPPTAVSYFPAMASYVANMAIPTYTPTVIGGTPTSYEISPPLPTGLSISATTGVISGTPPTASPQTSYTVKASNIAGSVNATVTITITWGPPMVTSFTPGSGYINDKIVLTGKNFGNVQSVRFYNEGASSVVVDSPTQITVRVPLRSLPGNVMIQVDTASGQATAPGMFTVLNSFKVWREDLQSTYATAPSTPTGTLKTGQNADLLLSGVDFNKTGGGLLFNHNSLCASDGTRLVLADRNNNRVLIWNAIPSGNTAPDLVLGQPDLESNDPGNGLHQMNWPVSISIGGGRLAVADTYNDRILLWDTFPTVSAQAASRAIVIPSLGLGNISWPWGVWTDGTKVAATATQGSTFLLWNSWPTVANQAPSTKITGQGLGTPRTITSNGSYLVVGDHNATVGAMNQMNFFWKSWPTVANQAADFYIQPVFDPNYGWMQGSIDGTTLWLFGRSLYKWNSLPQTAQAAMVADLVVGRNGTGMPPMFYDFDGGDGSGVCIAGSKLYVSGTNGNSLLVYNTPPTTGGQFPDYAIGAPDIKTNTYLSNYFVTNPVPVSDGTSLFVSSDFDRALYVHKTLPNTAGADPDYMFHVTFQPWANSLYGGKLFIAGEGHILQWDTLPINGAYPSNEFTNSIGNVSISQLKGVSWDGTYFAVATDSGVYAWNGIPASNANPSASWSLPGARRISSNGTKLVTTLSNGGVRIIDLTSPATPPQPVLGIFNLPESALLYGNKLFLADTGFSRVLGWNNYTSALVDMNTPDLLLGKPDLNDRQPRIGKASLFWPAAMTFDGKYFWVGEYKFSGRLVRYTVTP